MCQRRFGPSMGSIRLLQAVEIVSIPSRSARSFHLSARSLEDDKSNGAVPPPKLSEKHQTRRARSDTAFKAVRQLQQNPSSSTTTSTSAQTSQPSRLLFRKEMTDAPQSSSIGRGSRPPGTMVRAPVKLRVTRNAPPTSYNGPNLRGRTGPPSSSTSPTSSAGNNRAERAPRKRERESKKATSGPKKARRDAKIEETLSDGMVQQLFRLQRKEWDRVPYEPKYGHGSPEARQLLEAGKLLFAGEFPKVKSKQEQMLERRIGIVGMHGS